MAQFAAQDINKAGGVLGRPLKLIACDDRSDFAANGKSCALQMINAGAVALLTDCDADWSAPANLTAEAHKIPGISFCAGAPKFGVAGGDGPYTFSMGIATPNEADVAAEWAYQAKHWRKAYLLNDPVIAYDTTYCQYFAKRWRELGGTIAGQDTFQASAPSIAGQVARMRSTSMDFVVLCSIPPEGASAIRQMRAGGVPTPIIMNVGMGGDYWFNTVPGISNAYQDGYDDWHGGDPRAFINSLTRRWAAKYHMPNPRFPHAYMGYEALLMLADAMKKAGTTKGSAVANALRHLDVKGIFGTHKIVPQYDQSFTLPVAIIRINNGTASFLTLRYPEISTQKLLH
jgi:branched-chain amino acid transport system substrate-binding protein